MVYDKVKSYASSAITDIIPLDSESSKEIINYTLSLKTVHDIQLHLLNLLGESDESFKFISTFIAMKAEADSDRDISKKKVGGPKVWETNKQNKEGTTEKNKRLKEKIKSPSLENGNGASVKKSQRKSKKANINDLNDIEAVLSTLEEKTSEPLTSNEGPKRFCNCMATRHSLFEVAPNCLNCGKIICSFEGLQPCSYCGKELLSTKEKQEIISVLEEEKQKFLKSGNYSKSPPPQKPKRNKIVVSMAAGENLWKAQDKALKKVEAEKQKNQQELDKVAKEQQQVAEQEKLLKRYERSHDDKELDKAQERLETLLHFQETGSERTKVIDNAADYELPGGGSASIWLSPIERAVQLKKQQKQLKKYENLEASRTGRSQKTVEMVIKDGKVKMVEKYVPPSFEVEEKEIDELSEKLKMEKKASENNYNSTWDYEKDKERWEKPIFIDNGTLGNDESASDEMDQQKSRIQLEDHTYDNILLSV